MIPKKRVVPSDKKISIKARIPSIVKVLESQQVSWKPPQNSLISRQGGDITLDDIGGLVCFLIVFF